jgi:hypothetical protein
MDGFEFDYDGIADGVDTAEDLVHEVDFPDFVQHLVSAEYDLIGADPDEDGLWNHLMLDGDINPYVAN